MKQQNEKEQAALPEFCPKCNIGLSNSQKTVGYCNNCHYDFNDELREAVKEWDGLCRCGHKHSDHGNSTSVNYTAGRCSIPGCNCKHFIMPATLPVKGGEENRLLEALYKIMQLPGDWNESKQIARRAIGHYQYPQLTSSIHTNTSDQVDEKELEQLRIDYYEDKIEMLIRVGNDKDREIERLKGLIKYTYKQNTITNEDSWQQFKKKNNL